MLVDIRCSVFGDEKRMNDIVENGGISSSVTV